MFHVVCGLQGAHAQPGLPALPDGWAAGARPSRGGPHLLGPLPGALPGPGDARLAGAHAAPTNPGMNPALADPGPKPPGYYWGSPFSQLAGLAQNGAAPRASPGFPPPHSAANGDVGHTRFAPAPTAFRAEPDSNPGFEETPLSPPEEDRGAPPPAPMPLAMRQPLPYSAQNPKPRKPSIISAAPNVRDAGSGAARGAPSHASDPDCPAGYKRARYYPPPNTASGAAGKPAASSAASGAWEAAGNGAGPPLAMRGGDPGAAGFDLDVWLADVAAAAADVGGGRLSAEGAAVREGLRRLDPAEGLAVVAWLLDRLSHSVDPAGAAQVGAQ